MRKPRIYHRSERSIVQQLNVQSTKDVIKDFYSGKSSIDVNAGSLPTSFDSDSQVDVDLDQDVFFGFENLIDQGVRGKEVFDSVMNKKDPTPVDPPQPPPVDPAPPVDPV